MRGFWLFILALIFSAGSCLQAQEVSVDFLASVEFVHEPKSENYSLTTDSTQYFFTQYFDKSLMRSRCFMSSRSLRDAVSVNGQEVSTAGNRVFSGEINLPQGFSNVSNNVQDLHATVALDGQIYALVSTIRNEDGIRQVHAHDVSPAVETDPEGKLLLEFPIKGIIKSGRIVSSSSPNGQYLAVLGTHPTNRKKDALGELIVYDSELYPIGKIAVNLGNIRWTNISIHVSDQARVYITTFKEGFENNTTLNIYEFDVNEPENVVLRTVPLEGNERIATYNFKVLPNGDFWVIGTLEEPETISIGEQLTEQFFIYRITIAGDEMVINPMDVPTNDLRIREVHVTDGNLVYICGEVLIGNVESSIQFNYNMPAPDPLHGDEYIFGVDLEGTKLFEYRIEQFFEATTAMETHTGGYELYGDSLVVIHHDESIFWGGSEENNQLIAVVTVIGPDGSVITTIPFMGELTLPNRFGILPVLSEIDGSKITTFIRSQEQMEMIQIELNETSR